jgi:ArsR family transcriptional regulator
MLVVSNGIEILSRGRRRTKEVPAQVRRGVTRAGGYAAIASSLPDSRALAARTMVHRALSEGVRTRMLWALARSELCPCLLKELTGLSDSKLSYHLKVLTDAGLARVVKRRSWRVYSITEKGLAAIGRGEEEKG